MTASPISLETIKFHLVWNKDFSFNRESQTVSLEELMEFLIDSLQSADKQTANKAENLLTRIGQAAVPHLVQALKSPHNQVRSTCAMALIRIGQPAVSELQEFYARYANRAKLRWIVEFILGELGGQIPTLDAQELETTGKVLQFAKVAV